MVMMMVHLMGLESSHSVSEYVRINTKEAFKTHTHSHHCCWWWQWRIWAFNNVDSHCIVDIFICNKSFSKNCNKVDWQLWKRIFKDFLTNWVEQNFLIKKWRRGFSTSTIATGGVNLHPKVSSVFASSKICKFISTLSACWIIEIKSSQIDEAPWCYKWDWISPG